MKLVLIRKRKYLLCMFALAKEDHQDFDMLWWEMLAVTTRIVLRQTAKSVTSLAQSVVFIGFEKIHKSISQLYSKLLEATVMLDLEDE